MPLAIGTTAPQFTAKDLNGQDFDFADYEGCITVLAISAITWCEACQFEAPLLQELWEEYGGSPTIPPVKFVIVSPGMEFKEKLQAAVAQFGLTMPVVMNWQVNFTDLFQLNGVPTLFIVGTDGKVCAVHEGAGPPAADLKQAIRDDLAGCGVVRLHLEDWVAIAQIVFGVTQDGGGLRIVGGKPIPVPPWDPLHRLGHGGRDLLRALAVAELVSGFADPGERRTAQAAALAGVLRSARRLESGVQREGGARGAAHAVRKLGSLSALEKTASPMG